MFSFEFSLKERFYLSRTDFWLFNLTVRWLSAKQHKQVRFLQEPQLKVIKKLLNKTYAEDILIEYHDKCVNMLELCHKMGINDISGSTYKDIKNLANDLGVELKFSYTRGYSKHSTAKIPLENILVEHSPYKSLSKIRNRLIKEGLKEHRCEICGNNEWNGRPIPLQLHHINGNPTDNRIENLQVLCPNCHAQTDNYSGKNSYKDLDVTSSKIIEEYNEPKTFEETHPSRENLLSDFKELGSFTKIGKKYNVTEAAIRKWFSYYKLPRYAKDVKKMLGMKK